MSDLITNNLATQQNAIQALQRTETAGACLTLTRTATLAITTAATLITWQTEIRNNGFTWSGTSITIPTTGFYLIAFNYIASASVVTYIRINVAGVYLLDMPAAPGNRTRQAVTFTRYYTAADVITITVDTVSNHTMNVNAENAASESPIFHIVQMTGSQS